VPQASGVGGGILSPEGDRHHSLLLLLAVLCKTFAEAGVARALSTMITALPTRSDYQAMGVAMDDEEVDA
jgi:hypothetical protein